MANYYEVAANEIATPRITLQAGIECVVLFAEAVAVVGVVSLDGAAPIWWTLNGDTAEVDGKNCLLIPPGICRVEEKPDTIERTEVHLVSNGTPTVVVTRG